MNKTYKRTRRRLMGSENQQHLLPYSCPGCAIRLHIPVTDLPDTVRRSSNTYFQAHYVAQQFVVLNV